MGLCIRNHNINPIRPQTLSSTQVLTTQLAVDAAAVWRHQPRGGTREPVLFVGADLGWWRYTVGCGSTRWSLAAGRVLRYYTWVTLLRHGPLGKVTFPKKSLILILCLSHKKAKKTCNWKSCKSIKNFWHMFQKLIKYYEDFKFLKTNRATLWFTN